MGTSPDPYAASTAALPVDEHNRRPPALVMVLLCYVAHYLLQVVPKWGTSIVDFELFLPMMVVNGAYCLVMCVALYCRWQWARVWMVFTTVLTAFVLWRLVWRGVWAAQWPLTLSSVLRIAVAGMLFLPSIRRWFAPRRG